VEVVAAADAPQLMEDEEAAGGGAACAPRGEGRGEEGVESAAEEAVEVSASAADADSAEETLVATRALAAELEARAVLRVCVPV
jgi:hypothetical protein